MDSYIKYLIFVGLFVTIITIILFFVIYKYSDSSNQWPTKSNTCPDFWTIKNDINNGPMCYDTLRISPNDNVGAIFNPNSVYPEGTTNECPTGTKEWGGIPANGSSIDYNGGCTERDNQNFGSSSEWATHCGKRKWANDNGIAWDGITNSNIDCSSYLGSASSSDNLFD